MIYAPEQDDLKESRGDFDNAFKRAEYYLVGIVFASALMSCGFGYLSRHIASKIQEEVKYVDSGVQERSQNVNELQTKIQESAPLERDPRNKSNDNLIIYGMRKD